jgi:hypothetical protein
MSRVYALPNFINSYLLSDISDDEEQDPSNNIHTYLGSNPSISCTFCGKREHSEENCSYILSIGSQLNLKGLEVKDFDLIMKCNGNSVKAWIHSLTMYQVKFLARKIQLSSFSYHLYKDGYITEEQSLLYTRSDYNISLQYYYYLKPNLAKKIIFKPKVMDCDQKSISALFECPICIQHSLPVQEKLIFNCSHCVCNTCFHHYLDYIKNDNNLKVPICSLCRTQITCVEVVNVHYLRILEKKDI